MGDKLSKKKKKKKKGNALQILTQKGENVQTVIT
jgi:hypothetical protein